MKTSELSSDALKWAVAKAEGHKGPDVWIWIDGFYNNVTTDWAQGGPIIEREWLHITPWPNESDEDLRWQCEQHDNRNCIAFGPTPLIAAMRCFVASKLGDEVELPAELTGE